MEQDINKLDASLFMPTYIANPFIPPQYGLLNASMQPQAPIAPTIIKNYSISAPGPVGLHEKISYIYEDMLPTINIPGKITTLKERNSLQGYLRSILFPRGDGEDINLDERSNSILQHIKYMDLNPYNTYDLERNPYKTLPENFLLYRSCYPIKKEGSTTQCAKNSIGMNLRIYKLDYEAYAIHKSVPIGFDSTGKPILSTKKYTDFDSWREVLYYKYVRDYIIKKEKCPNFVNLLGYYINEKSQIDFDKINNIIKSATGVTSGISAPALTVSKIPATTVPGLLSSVYSVSHPTPKTNFGQALIALTEAPIYNLLGFASTIYQRDGAVKRMISTGYYNENIWYSILFQIMIALYILQKEKIYFNNFEVDHNIFIKDLSLHSNLTNFWKYIINGVEYYIPNYGYMALFDANFRNNYQHDSTIKNKILAEPLEDDLSKFNIEELIFDNMFKKTFDPDIFNQADTFLNLGGIKPPTKIMDLLGEIKKDTMSKNIIDFIEKYMTRFINNRVGTYLKESEISNIRRDDKNFKNGQIIVEEVAINTYKFGLIKDITNLTCKILTRNDSTKEIIEKDSNINSIYSYSKGESIEQTFKPNEINLNEDDLLETYIISY